MCLPDGDGQQPSEESKYPLPLLAQLVILSCERASLAVDDPATKTAELEQARMYHGLMGDWIDTIAETD